MRPRNLVAIACLLILVAGMSGGVASAAPPNLTVTITPSSGPETWTGNTATGANQTYSTASGGPCDENPANPAQYCDITLLRVNAPSFWDTHGGGVQLRLYDYTVPTSDFDVYVYKSNAAGDRGAFVGSGTGLPGAEESTTLSEPNGYYLVHVAYFAVTASSYTGEVKFVARSENPRDIDRPRGLQEFLASNPSLGFKSHSEPHVAQSPLDPRILIAGSKMYNRDRDSLKEYEFKIGTYVSFNSGRTWTDLGQARVCSIADAPPSSWPNNTCYPRDNPNRGGTGPEDVNDPADATDPYDNRGSTDRGEQYITSDPWIDFDDEGNAYLMVLDSPPYEAGENGWGMTLHRWNSVSRTDLKTGKTWGRRLPISAYQDGALQQLFLDDKNTFAVNNAGPNRDGTSGIIVSCWGQNVVDLIKQQTACNRSTDRGETWSTPIPISEAQQLVIGVHVIADRNDAETFYAVWHEYASATAAGEGTMMFNRSTDGGLTWETSRPATVLTPLPRSFPGQSFRNLSIPIMAVAPNGDLYATYAEYLPAPKPGQDEDGMQSDIMMVKSTDSGLTWSAPINVTETTKPNVNADQFQQSIAINRTGQINITYFDRRLDEKRGSHPGNFFVDVWLSRSNNGGDSFKSYRLTHESSSPEVNAPISPSGRFFGDYQGLVADECSAMPFYNNTHMISKSSRDRTFDRGMPGSKYQEVHSWIVPNDPEFGGTGLSPKCRKRLPKLRIRTCPQLGNVAGNHILGTTRADVLIGTKGRDIMCGRGGNDRIRGLEGNDLIIGGGGADTMLGGQGRDRLRGMGGDDDIDAGAGNDRLGGGEGKDVCDSGPGNDTFGPGCDKKIQ